jgi:hypothetical protein
MLIAQTAQFMGMRAEDLFEAYLTAETHQAMIIDGSQLVTFYRPSQGEVARGEAGDELRAFGVKDPDGDVTYSLKATILELQPPHVIVMSWRNKAFDMALDPADIASGPSTVILTFRNNSGGAQIQLVQANVPSYKARITETGEVGPLSELVDTHWNLLYWEPMKQYFQSSR